MKLSGSWITQPETQAVFRALLDAGFETYFVGGCVRNALIGAPISDLDVTTNAEPKKVMSLVRKAGLRAVPTGIEHGTVTVISGHIPYEITTFRKDVETDGRRAVVAFADTLEEDARRRDFTMNALYADVTGTVFDPLGTGQRDLQSRLVRFIEDPQQRIREDYLRILRFFRFHAWYGDPEAGLDPDALAAISANLAGIEALSRERIGAEVIKLLSAVDPGPALAAMRITGVLHQVLPGTDTAAIGPLTVAEAAAGIAPDPICRLAALGGQIVGADLRLSNRDKRKLSLFQAEIGTVSAARELSYRHGTEGATKILLLRAALFEQALDLALMADVRAGSQAVFPVKASDLMPELSGAALGAKLKLLEKHWIDSGFEMTKDQLLA